MVEENNPLVSIIVPSYNHEKYIVQTIESIVNQTYKNIEFIVVDDGSKDNSVSILKEFSEKYKFKLILQENKGVARTITDSIKQYAKGKYISLCASDDYWVDNKIELQVKFMEDNPEFAMCFGKTYYIDTNSNIIGDSLNQKFKGGYIFEEIINQKFHPPVNYMIKKSIIEEFGYYKEGIIAEDYYMNCLISKKYQIGYIEDILGYYRTAPLKSKRDPYMLLQCHRNTIDIFKNDIIYKDAVSYSNLRMAYSLSCYKEYKILSVKYLFLSINMILDDRWFKSIYHIFFIWI